MKRHALTLLMILVSFLGFMDATYLTVEHYRGVAPPCSIVLGCEIVTTSNYSVAFNIPVALLGAIFYLAIFVLSISHLESGKDGHLMAAIALTPFGFLASVYFVYLQVVVIKAICIYCMGSALSSTMLFVLGIVTWRTKETWKERLQDFWHRLRKK